MQWPKRPRDRAGLSDDPRREIVHDLDASGIDAGALETAIIAIDRTGKDITTIHLDLSTLQADAELAAAADGDPVQKLAQIIVERLAAAGADVRDRSRRELESQLADSLLAGRWPRRIDVPAVKGRATMHSESSRREILRVRGGLGEQAPEGHSSRPMERGPGSMTMPPELFEKHIHYPSPEAQRAYVQLVGLDSQKTQLVKEAILLTQPQKLASWSERHHGAREIRALAAIQYGTPLIIFAGDVGTGKSMLAESFGEAVAQTLGEPVSLLRMSIQTRGSGIVGDMTRQISRAFATVEAEARRTKHVTILLLDEADALAESRETAQMHHEDRAGVNALIQGVDHLRGAGVPAFVVFCSNRLASIDPAVLRRAVSVFEFRRPDSTQRLTHLENLLGDLRLSQKQLSTLVELTGPREGRAYGFTYSDISDRFVRNAVLAAFPDEPISFALLERTAKSTAPTRPFTEM